MAGGQPLFQHDAPGGAEEGGAETGRLKRLRAVVVAPGYTLRAANSATGSTNYLITILHNLTHNYTLSILCVMVHCIIFCLGHAPQGLTLKRKRALL